MQADRIQISPEDGKKSAIIESYFSPHTKEQSDYPEKDNKWQQKKAENVLGIKAWLTRKGLIWMDTYSLMNLFFVVIIANKNISIKKLPDYKTQIYIMRPPFIHNFYVKVRASITKSLGKHLNYYELLCCCDSIVSLQLLCKVYFHMLSWDSEVYYISYTF